MYLQGTNYRGLVFNTYKIMAVDCYVDVYFGGMWVHGNTKDTICAKSRTGFVVTFTNFPLFWVSKIHTEISLSDLNSEYEFMTIKECNLL